MSGVKASDLGIISSAFTAATGLKLRHSSQCDDYVNKCRLCGAEKPPPQAPRQSWLEWIFGRIPQLEVTKLTAQDLFGMTYGRRKPQAPLSHSKSLLKKLTVYVHILKSHVRLTVDVEIASTVKKLREDAAKKLELRSPQKLMLIYDNSQLEDHQEIKYQGMTSGCMIFGMICSPGQKMGIFELDPESLAPEFDHDFTNEKDDGDTYKRGKFEYQRPYGWKRYAIKVVGEYEDDKWLGQNGIRTETTPGEWPVSYHGTGKHNVKGTVEEGYTMGQRQLFGAGVYTSPSYKKVAEHYGQTFTHDGKRYRFILQNRVNEQGLKIVAPKETGYDDFPYWVSNRQNPAQDKFCVRPYGILTLEV